MLLRFLRLFPTFRRLEAEVEVLRAEHQRLTGETLVLQDRLDALREDRTKLWDLAQECLRGERTAYQMHVNQAWQRQGAGAPYPEAPHLPAEALPKRQQGTEPVGRQGRILPSEAVQRQTNDFIERLVKAPH